ncbi:AAA family ATPase [Sorangium sp. So ce185]|uniref:AAA family ATPase n=1 Tax=Sorangium sp. So ce185 TaxID=3133287 RepID=UPI003F6157D5
MLTRLEIDGFKNLLGLKVDFGPFTCIAGPNGSGKSNVFDAIQFLSLLADHEIMRAAQMIRSVEGRGEDPRHLFWTDGTTRVDTMRFAAEMIVPAVVRDDFGREVNTTTTFLRYELELSYEEPSNSVGSLGRLKLLSEHLGYLKRGEAHEHLRWEHSKREFRDHVIVGTRKGKAFISTDMEDGKRTIRVHQDGGSRGHPKPWPADTAPRTIVCTTATASDPTILAARREMQSWRLLMLEPSAMRSPDPFLAKPYIEPNGAHLAAALYRLATAPQEDGQPRPHRVYGDIAAQLTGLVDVAAIRVDRDDRRELLTLELQQPKGGFLPARSLSDGTLRFLALCIINNDPAVEGLICMEEPENGIHPERIGAMVDLVRGLAVDPHRPPGDANPFRQIIVNTHSPLFVQLQHAEDLLFAKPVTVQGPSKAPVRTMRLLPVNDPRHHSWRISPGEVSVGRTEILAYLSRPPGAQLTLGDYAA